MVNSTVSLLQSYIKEGAIKKLRSFGFLLALSFLLASCSSGPSDKEIITALKADFNKGNMPQCFVHSLLGGGIYQDTLQFEILKKGDLVKESPQAFMPGNYYPARVRVKGKGWGEQLFGKKQDHQFDCTLEIQMRKGDYKEWKADFDPFKSDWNKTEATVPSSAARSEASANLQTLRLLEEQYFVENGRYAPNPDATWTYNGTYGVADSGIEDIFPGFKPGVVADLKYNYVVQSSGTGRAFLATATGKAGTNVSGDVLTIDQKNVKGGGW